MQHRSLIYAGILSIPLALLWGGCDNGTKTDGSKAPAAKDHDHAHPFEGVNHAICVLSPTEGSKAAGWFAFAEKDGKVTVTGEVTGLTPNQKHAFHVHEFGDLRPKDGKNDGMSTGGHYNPENHPDHGLPDKAKRHAGDFGNLQADGDGKATVNVTFDNITVAGEKNPILGRAMIVHAKEDDGKNPNGNAGGRILQGVIGVAKDPAAK